MASPLITVIIPVLNEEPHLAATLDRLRGLAGVEILVVDGGSSDNTRAIGDAAGVRILESRQGRAVQMNTGAAAARGEILLFLHADTRLPENFLEPLRRVLERPGVAIGAFRLRIDAEGMYLRLIEWTANWRASSLRLPYGDQALFLKKWVFCAIGGFPEQPLLEDMELVRKARKLGRLVILPLTVSTSARRWRRLGILKTTLINQAILLAYLAGIHPARLAEWYTRAGNG